MSRKPVILLPIVFGALAQLIAAPVFACKPCPEPTLAGLVAKADIVAVAEVVKVDVTSRAPDPQATDPRPLQDVRWQVKIARRVKGNPPNAIRITHGDSPPCISAVVPQPGRYLVLLYQRGGQFIPLNYCDQALFPIDAQDRVELPPQIVKELRAPTSLVPLGVVVDAVRRMP